MKPDDINQILITALEEFKELEFSHIPEETEINYKFSDDYTKKRNRITKNLSRSYWKFINTTAKKVAVIITSLIIAFSSLMTVDAFREKVIEFIFKIYETFTVIEPDIDHNPDVIETYYTIKKDINLTKSSEHNSGSMYSVYYSNKNDQDVLLMQHPSATFLFFDSEAGELKEEYINDTPCLTCENDINYFCYWEFDGYRFELIYPKDLGKEFMSTVVGNLIEVTPENIEE